MCGVIGPRPPPRRGAETGTAQTSPGAWRARPSRRAGPPSRAWAARPRARAPSAPAAPAAPRPPGPLGSLFGPTHEMGDAALAEAEQIERPGAARERAPALYDQPQQRGRGPG